MSKYATLLRVLEAVKSKENHDLPCDFWLSDGTVNSLMSESTTRDVEKGKLVLRFLQEDGQIIISIHVNNGVCDDDHSAIAKVEKFVEKSISIETIYEKREDTKKTCAHL